MHEPTMTLLEFPRIQAELAAHAACGLGKELALRIAPLPSPDLIRRVQQETTEAKAIVSSGRSIPFGSIQDIRVLVERSAIGGVLRPAELTTIAETIYGCRQLHRFLLDHKAEAPLLSRYGAAFGQFAEVEAEISRCIERGTVSSQASRTLKQTRSEIAVLENRIQERLSGLLRQYRSHLQESLVTSRNGRYVIPVKAASRASVPGTVHGSSASGSTLFIEPDAVSQLCAELETWRAMEAAEVEQILIALSAQVATRADGLMATLSAVAELDLIFARGRLSRAWDARPVRWNEDGLVDLRGARHPLLGSKAVGNRIRITADQRMLIVTGPNTGGKTLLLKTLGLLIITAQAGLHLPVDEDSTLCFFHDVFADIGDHQSLEQSLSTFSGHIAAVTPMLAQADSQTLVLLDELGSGTDPHEGTGLGIALLEAFLKRRAYVLVTTHLREIKEFGRVTPGCSYAGMGFDGETLRPTYQLIYGALGESRGLEIAQRAGLPAEVVQRARDLVYGAGAPASTGGTTPVPPAVAPAAPVPAAPVPAAPAPAAPAPAAPAPVPAAPAQPRRSGAARTAPAPAAPPAATVLAPLSPSRCAIFQDGARRELTVPDPVRHLFPEGLVPGDRLRLRDGRIAEVSRRQSVLVSRDADTMAETVVAANATRLLVLVSARQPDFHAPVLARHLLYAERQSVQPIICLTKADLVPAATIADWLKPFRQAGYQTVVVSIRKRQGLEELTAALTGQTSAVICSPGAGKSTLLAALTGQTHENSPTPAVLPLSADTWLIDMPTLRELGVWKPDLGSGFSEFGPFVGRCNRQGCLHGQEPGCAVREAVEQGHLQRKRYEQYRQLMHQMRLA